MEDNKAPMPKKKEDWRDMLRFALIALAIVIPIRYWVAKPFIVEGRSMVPTFHDGEYLIVDELSYNIGKPSRGDVAVFKPPIDERKHFIKRVIGLPGDTVTIEGSTVTITNAEHPDGVVLEEPYVEHAGRDAALSFTVGPDQYFVMGDNRLESFDSRGWGLLPKRDLVGRAFLRLFPLSRISHLPGEYPQPLN